MTQNNHDLNTIDWEAIRRSLTRDETREQALLLRQRAQQYARPLQSEIRAASILDVLAFTLGEERYAVEVAFVRSVRTLPPLTPVPGTPGFYAGVVNVRGQIITVLDLRAFFELNTHDRQSPHELVIVQASGLEIGLLAEHVRGVETYAESVFAAVDPSHYIKGVTHDQLALLDIETLFADKRLILGSTEE